MIHFKLAKGGHVRTVLIYFMGMDGSGKSTLSNILYNDLKLNGYDVELLWWFECENSYIRKLLRMFFKQKNKGTNSAGYIRKPSLLTNTLTLIYITVVLVDYMRFAIIKLWVPKLFCRNKIIIMDRSIFDVIQALSTEFKINIKFLFNFYVRLYPEIDLIYYLDVTPEIAFSRKKGEIRSLERAQEIYLKHKEIYMFMMEIYSKKLRVFINTGDLGKCISKIFKETNLFLGELNKNEKKSVYFRS